MNSYLVRIKIEDKYADRKYLPCTDGKVVVLTDDPVKIYDKFGRDKVLSIETAGEGYYLK